MKKDIFNITIPRDYHGYRIDKFLKLQMIKTKITFGQEKLSYKILYITYYLLHQYL